MSKNNFRGNLKVNIINQKAAELEEIYSKLNSKESNKCAIATTVYMKNHNEEILLLQQTKSNRVVGDNYVGVGGKTPVETMYGDSNEKTDKEKFVSSMLANKLSIRDIEETAIREVREETGLEIQEQGLEEIGFTQVTLENGDIWFIKNYLYNLTGEEGRIGECNEGKLAFFSKEKIKRLNMFPHDKLVLLQPTIYKHIESFNNGNFLKINEEDGYILIQLKPEIKAVKAIYTEKTYQDGVRAKYVTKYEEVNEKSLKQLYTNLGVITNEEKNPNPYQQEL